jgi:hypothetical protein
LVRVVRVSIANWIATIKVRALGLLPLPVRAILLEAEMRKHSGGAVMRRLRRGLLGKPERALQHVIDGNFDTVAQPLANAFLPRIDDKARILSRICQERISATSGVQETINSG